MNTLDALRELVAAVRPVELMMREASGPRVGYDCTGCGVGLQLTEPEAARGCPSCEDAPGAAGELVQREPGGPLPPEDVCAWVLRECNNDMWAVLAHVLTLAEVAIVDAELYADRPDWRTLPELESALVAIDRQMSLGQVRS